jgi:beta-galactosidase
MYAPGPWFRRGANEILVLDLIGPEKAEIGGLEKPIVAALRPKADFARSARRAVSLAADFGTPAKAGEFAPGTELQEVRLAQPARGRYFCLEALSAQDGKPFASVAELSLLDESGKPLPADSWTIAYVDSEERERGDGLAENAIDGQSANIWQTEWGNAQPGFPHRLIIDLGETRTIGGFRYTPRQGGADLTGRIKQYRVYVGEVFAPRKP